MDKKYKTKNEQKSFESVDMFSFYYYYYYYYYYYC